MIARSSQLGYTPPVTHGKPLLTEVDPQTLRRQVRRVVEEILKQTLSEQAVDDLLLYLEQVEVWGRRVDLIAPRSWQELLELSLVDAAVMARWELDRGRSGDRLIDVGSGGGAPAFPLLVLLRHLRGGCSMTLVEPRTKRVAFLRSVAGLLGGEVPTVLRQRSDELPAGGFDVAFSRATLAPGAWLTEGARLAGRAVWVLLAREDVPASSQLAVEIDHHYQLPFSGARRRAVRFVPLLANE